MMPGRGAERIEFLYCIFYKSMTINELTKILLFTVSPQYISYIIYYIWESIILHIQKLEEVLLSRKIYLT